MTKNNLKDQLAWLLGNLQLSTPVGPSLPTATDSFESSRSFASLSSLPSSGEPNARVPARAPAASSSSTVEAPQIDLTIDEDSLAEIALDDITTGHGQEHGMARLTAKSTRKPSLVSKQEQLPTPAPSTTGGGLYYQAYTASLSKDVQQHAPAISKRSTTSAARPSINRPSRPTPWTATGGIPEEDDDGFHDLTKVETSNPDVTDPFLWPEDHTLGPEPALTPRGRKRKSGEMTKASPRRKRPVEPEDDEYPDIADFLDDDMMTPAMVKRRAAGSQSARRSPPNLHLASPDGTILTQRTVTQTVSTTETRIRRPSSSMGQTPSRIGPQSVAKSESPFEVEVVEQTSRLARRPSPGSPMRTDPKQPLQSPVGKGEFSDDGFAWSSSPQVSRRRGRGDVIMDSDDEFQTPPSRKNSHVPLINDTAIPISKQEHVPFQAKQETPIDNNSKPGSERMRPSQAPEGDVVIRSSQPVAQADVMDIDRSADEHKPADVAVRTDPHSSETDGATLVMDLFLEKPHILWFLTKMNDEKTVKNSADFGRSLREKWPPERKLQVKREKEPLSKQKKALSDLKACHEAYKVLLAQKEDLVTQIGMMYDADEDTTATEAQVEELDLEIERSERSLKQALVTAGVTSPAMFEDLPDSQPEEPEPSDPTEKATSAKITPSSSRDTTVIPECLSQVVKQTQQVAAAPRQQQRFEGLAGRSEVVKPPVPQSRYEEPRSSRKTGSHNTFKSPYAAQDDLDMEDLLDDDDDLWAQPYHSDARAHALSSVRGTAAMKSKSPAKHKVRRQENHSDYGDGDDDLAAMVAMAEEAEDFEQRQSSIGGPSNRRARSVLSETSGNTSSTTARVKATSKKPVKPVPKPKIPPELLKFPWSSDLLRAFKDRFRLEGFRHNQLEAINATLDGKDAFVLMPTGGGKSLCYQLPAVINSGKTRGVTIVVTPLLSLMQDQVDHLTARGIVAKAFSGDTDRREKDDILQSFKLRNPEHHVQLLYVTPEMLSKSAAFGSGLMTLWRNKKLARLVIDEAHCVSQWGHDFRPDYKMLGEVRRKYPGVPVMALTATATNNVIVDIKHNLDMEGCTVFSQSFNRPNLYYEIRPKEKQPVERIADIINERFAGKTGIVYTLSRKQTENIAKKLTERGIRAEHYHAALQTEEKTQVQRDWQSGRVKVVVATIAFGMGIDKPDVRFVIHHYIPKSLEGYYQETGRAGRDGLPSDCILFFGHGDIHSLRKMIDDGDGSRQQKERQKEMLNRVVMFCENSRDCRRSQLLHYFGETFSRDKCEKTCDNCRIGGTFEVADRTKYARAALEAVMYHTRLTLNQCTDVLRGTKKADGDEEGQSFHGIARHLKKPEVSSVIVRLAAEGALDEENRVGGGGIAIQYFILGGEAASFLSGGRKLEVVVRTSGDKNAPAKATKKKTTKGRAAIDAHEELARPASTLVSSPVRRGAAKSRKGKTVATFFDEEAIAEDDEHNDLEHEPALHYNGYEQDDFCVPDDEDDYFEPLRKTAIKSGRQRTLEELGPPISRMADGDTLDDVHEVIVTAFLEEAKNVEERVRNNKSFRRPLFTEAQLRLMAVRWTTTVDQMRRIPGIKSEHVDKFGAKFIPIVKQFHENYREMMGQGNDGAMATIPGTAGPSAPRRAAEPQSDIIDLVSDEDDAEDDDYEDPGVPSKYFGGPGAAGADDPIQSQLDTWSERYAATSQMDDSGPVSRGRSTSKRGGGSKKNFYRKGGGGGSSSRGGGARSYGGVSKGKGRRTSGGSSKAGASSRGGGSRSGAGGRGGGGGGIAVMPF